MSLGFLRSYLVSENPRVTSSSLVPGILTKSTFRLSEKGFII